MVDYHHKFILLMLDMDYIGMIVTKKNLCCFCLYLVISMVTTAVFKLLLVKMASNPVSATTRNQKSGVLIVVVMIIFIILIIQEKRIHTEWSKIIEVGIIGNKIIVEAVIECIGSTIGPFIGICFAKKLIT